MKRKKRRGMSLVEVMVTIAIILTLTSILAIGVFGVFEQSRERTTTLLLGKVGEQVALFRLAKGRVPTEAEGLAVLDGRIPDDGWGRPLFYRSPGPEGAAFLLGSLGGDGVEGGDDDLVFVPE